MLIIYVWEGMALPAYEDIKEHVDDCEKCRAEYEKLVRQFYESGSVRRAACPASDVSLSDELTKLKGFKFADFQPVIV